MDAAAPLEHMIAGGDKHKEGQIQDEAREMKLGARGTHRPAASRLGARTACLILAILAARPAEASIAPQLAAPQQDAPFAGGELVNHAKFGLGRVQKFTDMGDDSIVTVSFNSGMTKTLVLKFAKLEKAQN